MSRRTMIQLGILIITVAFATPLLAVQASLDVISLQQPDGTHFRARQWGDEWLSGWETVDGYSIVLDEATGWWFFAERATEGDLVASRLAVARDSLPGDWPSRLRPEGAVVARALELRASAQTPRNVTATAKTGTGNVPVVLMTFSDRTSSYNPSAFQTLLFGTGTYSAADYYREVSYGRFSISSGPGGVFGWFIAQYGHDYYGADQGDTKDYWHADLVYEAAYSADYFGFNFAPYDQDGDCIVDVFAVVFQGQHQASSTYGSPTDIWPKQWYLSAAQAQGQTHYGAYTTNDACAAGGFVKVNRYIIQSEMYGPQITTIGTFAHEYAHGLDAADLYDYGSDSQGVGVWSLMAAGSDTGVTRYGDRPSHLDPWHKRSLGWVTPQSVSGTLTGEQISPAHSTADVYFLRSGGGGYVAGGEYFLVENRQRAGFDAGLSGSGVLIWHVDDSWRPTSGRINDDQCFPGGPPCALQHYQVAVVQADGLWELERNIDPGDSGDPFPGATNNTSFTPTSNPNSNLYSGAVSYVSVTDIRPSGTGSGPMIATLSVTAGSCTYSIAPTSQSFSAAAGTGSVSVTAGAGCAWTASSGVSWVTITGGSSGTGNGTVSYSVAANSGGARNGTLTIAGQQFAVGQAAGGACSAPAVPSGLTSNKNTICSNEAFEIGWSTVSGALNYTLEMATDGAFTNKVNLNNNTFNAPPVAFTLTGAYVGPLFIHVRANAACGTSSAYSNALQISYTGNTCSGPTSYLIPAVAHASGANNTVWRTDMSLVNRGTSSSNVTLTYTSIATGAALSQTRTLDAGATVGWSDVLTSLFGMSASAADKGIVQIASSSPVAAVARTYNSAPTGTFGQAYPALTTEDGITQGQSAVLPHLPGNSAFRTNVGLVNLGTQRASVTVKLFGTSGAQLGNAVPVDIDAGRYAQVDRIHDAAGAGVQDLSYATVEVNTAGASVWAFAAVVDNATGDPTTIEMIPATGSGSSNQLVPAVAHASGANNTQWRTDMSVVNRSSSAVNVTLTYTSIATGSTLTQNRSLGAAATMGWNDILTSLFGMDQAVADKGVLRVSAAQPLYIVSRTYNQTATGTFGQAYPALKATEGISRGQVAVLPHLAGNSAFRTNVGFVNLGTQRASVTVKLYGTSGAQLGNAVPMDIDPGRYAQIDRIHEVAGAGAQHLTYATVEVNTSSSSIWAFAAVVDNATGDPTTIEMIVP